MEERHAKAAGRIGRRQYIKRWLVLLAIGAGVGVGQLLASAMLPALFVPVVELLVAVLYGLPSVILAVVWTMHRATDAGKDEAWGLLLLVPLVNVVVLVVFAAMPSASESQAG